MRLFLREFRRRQLLKAIVVYFIVAWMFTQIGMATVSAATVS